jgi:DNA-binding transcriptional LysR family regulator
MLDLRHFRYFIAIAEELHFARAAERLGIAPSTLTVQIQQIERALAAQLLHRTKRSVHLTEAGALFLDQARAGVAQFERAIDVGRRAGRGEMGRIMIGYVSSAALAGLLQQHLRRYRADWPDVQVRARELPMERLPDMVADGRLDLAFVRLPMALPDGVVAHVIRRDRFIVALHADHPLAGAAGPVDPARLADEDFIVPEQDVGTRETGRRGGFVPRIGAAPGNLLSVLTEVSVHAGVAVVPDVLAATVTLPGVVYRPLAGEPVESALAAIFRRNERAPAVRNLVAQCCAAPVDASS